jgi:hypothetical protein
MFSPGTGSGPDFAAAGGRFDSDRCSCHLIFVIKDGGPYECTEEQFWHGSQVIRELMFIFYLFFSADNFSFDLVIDEQ